jgi:hypothetical protein
VSPRKRGARRADLVTPEEYAALFSEQGGVCAICGNPPKEGGRALHVDHNHKTGEVRGLLCHYCNRFLVGPGIRPSKLAAAAAYVLTEADLQTVDRDALRVVAAELREVGR